MRKVRKNNKKQQKNGEKASEQAKLTRKKIKM